MQSHYISFLRSHFLDQIDLGFFLLRARLNHQPHILQKGRVRHRLLLRRSKMAEKGIHHAREKIFE